MKRHKFTLQAYVQNPDLGEKRGHRPVEAYKASRDGLFAVHRPLGFDRGWTASLTHNGAGVGSIFPHWVSVNLKDRLAFVAELERLCPDEVEVWRGVTLEAFETGLTPRQAEAGRKMHQVAATL